MWNKLNKIDIENMKFNSQMRIGFNGADQLGQGISKLTNLNTLDLNFQLKF